jgi:hypothetical protein
MDAIVRYGLGGDAFPVLQDADDGELVWHDEAHARIAALESDLRATIDERDRMAGRAAALESACAAARRFCDIDQNTAPGTYAVVHAWEEMADALDKLALPLESDLAANPALSARCEDLDQIVTKQGRRLADHLALLQRCRDVLALGRLVGFDRGALPYLIHDLEKALQETT